MKSLKVGIVGISGLVGQKILEVLNEYDFNVLELVLYGSSRSKGNKVVFKNNEYIVKELTKENIDVDLDIVFLAVDASISKEYSKLFAENKTYIIDNSSAFRLAENVSLIVPEVNEFDLKKDSYLVANPNCTTIQSVLPLKVIDELFGLKRVDYTTYQAVSGSGYEGINDLNNATKNVYPYLIKDNLIPLIDAYQEDGFSKEEHKMVNESKKILHLPNLEVSATCIRVPIENTHGVSIRVEVNSEVDLTLLEQKFKNAKGITLKNDTANNDYPRREEVDNQDSVHVGRIRKDLFNDKIIHLYCVGDNLRKGAASNSVQIAQSIIKKFF